MASGVFLIVIGQSMLDWIPLALFVWVCLSVSLRPVGGWARRMCLSECVRQILRAHVRLLLWSPRRSL